MEIIENIIGPIERFDVDLTISKYQEIQLYDSRPLQYNRMKGRKFINKLKKADKKLIGKQLTLLQARFLVKNYIKKHDLNKLGYHLSFKIHNHTHKGYHEYWNMYYDFDKKRNVFRKSGHMI